MVPVGKEQKTAAVDQTPEEADIEDNSSAQTEAVAVDNPDVYNLAAEHSGL